jgi:hypothetical protein
MKKKKEGDTPINTRYPPEVLEQIRRLAIEHERSFNGEVIWALREYIKHQKGEEHDHNSTSTTVSNG